MKTFRNTNSKISKSYWEDNLNDKHPTDGNMDAWIRAKYEQKLWVRNEKCSEPSEIVVSVVKEQVMDLYILKLLDSNNKYVLLSSRKKMQLLSKKRRKLLLLQ